METRNEYEVPPARACESFRPGHTVHYIQALRRDREADRRGRVIDIDGEVITICFAQGHLERFRNHDTSRLRALLIRQYSTRIALNDPFSLLLVPEPGGNWCVSITPDGGEPLGPCPTDPLVATDPTALAARLETHGGFLVPVSALGPSA